MDWIQYVIPVVVLIVVMGALVIWTYDVVGRRRRKRSEQKSAPAAPDAERQELLRRLEKP